MGKPTQRGQDEVYNTYAQMYGNNAKKNESIANNQKVVERSGNAQGN